jgi:hypothetical protein
MSIVNKEDGDWDLLKSRVICGARVFGYKKRDLCFFGWLRFGQRWKFKIQFRILEMQNLDLYFTLQSYIQSKTQVARWQAKYLISAPEI